MIVGIYRVVITYNTSKTLTPASATLTFDTIGKPDGSSRGAIISKVSALFNALSNYKNYDHLDGVMGTGIGNYFSVTNVLCDMDSTTDL